MKIRISLSSVRLVATLLSSIALAAAGSSVSVSNLHGGSYSYGIDHDNYGAWYGAAQPHSLGVVSSDGISGLYGHGALSHGPVSHGDIGYGYETYGSGFGYGDYGHATSFHNEKSTGGSKILHAGHEVNHGHGATSYQSIYQKTGSGLYGGYGSDEGYSHGNYAGGYGHGSYGGGISSQNFNLKSYVHQPISYDVGSQYIQTYHTPALTYSHNVLGDIGSFGQYSGDYGHDYEGYSPDHGYSSIHAPSYGALLNHENYGYNGYGHGYGGYGQDFTNGYSHSYDPSYSGLSFY